MKILHCCLSCFYIDGYNYQENVLPSINKADGNEVKIIASTETFVKSSQIGYTNPGKYFNKDGIEVERIPYKRYLPHFIMKKVRHYKNLYKLIEEFSPNVILFHGVPAYDLLTVAKYKKCHPDIKLYIDSHEDFNNSALNYISREILHRRFYAKIVKRSLPYIDKVLCISIECFDFLEKLYRIPREKMELYPLGGVIFNDVEWKDKRFKVRKALDLNENDILLVHSGKMDIYKRTEDLLKAFIQIKSKRFKLILIGSLTKDIEEKINILIGSDQRIKFIGWKDSTTLLEYLCAADVYVQPGSQSATMQNALCCRCPVMVYPHKGYKPYIKNNGFYVKTVDDMVNVFNKIDSNPKMLQIMSNSAYNVACKLLDYSKLAERLYDE